MSIEVKHGESTKDKSGAVDNWLDAPAVLFGGAKIFAEFFAELLEEHRGGDDLLGIGGDVGGTKTAVEHAVDAALDPVRFGAKSKGFAQHHADAENRSQGIGGIFSR